MGPPRLRQMVRDPKRIIGVGTECAVYWRPRLRCYDALVYTNGHTAQERILRAAKLRTGSLLDACAFALSPHSARHGARAIAKGPPPDACPPEPKPETAVTASNRAKAKADVIHYDALPSTQGGITIAVRKPKKEKPLQNQTPQQSGVGMVAVDASRVDSDYSYAATLPRGSRVFAVGWDDSAGLLLMYSAVPFSSDEPESTLDEVQRLWIVPAEMLQQAAPSGSVYLGSVNVEPNIVMFVFRESVLGE